MFLAIFLVQGVGTLCSLRYATIILKLSNYFLSMMTSDLIFIDHFDALVSFMKRNSSLKKKHKEIFRTLLLNMYSNSEDYVELVLELSINALEQAHPFNFTFFIQEALSLNHPEDIPIDKIPENVEKDHIQYWLDNALNRNYIGIASKLIAKYPFLNANIGLMKSIIEGNIETFKFLLNLLPLQSETDINLTFSMCLEYLKLEFIEYLLAKDYVYDWNFVPHTGVHPILLITADFDGYEMVEFLLEKGVNPNSSMPNGLTALSKAYVVGNFKIANLLLEYGADINSANELGVTALMASAQHLEEHEVSCLIYYGADIFRKDIQGRDILYYASLSSSEDVLSNMEERHRFYESKKGHE